MKTSLLFIFLLSFLCNNTFSVIITSDTKIIRFQPEQVLTTGDRIRPFYPWHNVEMNHMPIEREALERFIRIAERIRVLEPFQENDNTVNNESL